MFFNATFLASNADPYHQERYNAIWEYTFYCAIDPALRPHYFSVDRALISPRRSLDWIIFSH